MCYIILFWPFESLSEPSCAPMCTMLKLSLECRDLQYAVCYEKIDVYIYIAKIVKVKACPSHRK